MHVPMRKLEGVNRMTKEKGQKNDLHLCFTKKVHLCPTTLYLICCTKGILFTSID